MIIDRLKYHYVYKITHLPTKRYYIGIHSTNNLNDGYMGSGNIIRCMYKKHPQDEFIKEYLYFGSCRQDVLDKEAELVTEKLIIIDPLILNLDVGGRSGNKQTNTRRIPVIDENGNKLVISNDDPRFLSGQYKHVNAGRKIRVTKIMMFKDGKYCMVPKADIDIYLSNGWVKQSKSKGRVSPTKGLICIKKGSDNMMVQLSQLDKYLADGWVRGRNVATINGLIMITKDGVDKYCSHKELDKYLADGWVRGGRSRNSGRVMLVNKLTGKYASTLSDDPKRNDENWVPITVYHGSPAKNTIYMHKDGYVKRVKKELVNQYLTEGWKKGTNNFYRAKF